MSLSEDSAPSPIIREPADFWLVWSKRGGKSRFIHATESQAQAEAQRLASLIPGRRFIVLRATEQFVSPQPGNSVPPPAIPNKQKPS